MKSLLNKSELMKSIESEKNELIEEVLRKLYVDKNMTTNQVAHELSINYSTAFDWLKKSGIYSHQLSSLM